jgi:outer membrane lipoprotein-sorting protein
VRQDACYAARLLRSFAALLTIVLAACGGGGTPAAGPNASAANEGAAAPSGAAAAAPSQAADSGPSFAEILQSGKLTSYKISYKMTTSGTGQDAAASLEQTWYFKPPNTRFDMAGDASGDGKISMFMLEKGTFMCTEASGQSSCFQVPGESTAGQNMGFDLQSTFQDDPSAFNATRQEQRTIAGQQAHCYVLAGTPVTGFSSGTFCYTKTGVPLLSEWVAQGATFKMEATSFSATVPDSDFELPATPGSY